MPRGLPRTDRERHGPSRTTGGWRVGVHDSASSNYPMEFPTLKEARGYAREALYTGIDAPPPDRITIHPHAWESGGRQPADWPKVHPAIETHYRKGARGLQDDAVHHGADDLSHVFGQQDAEVESWNEILRGAQSRIGNFRQVRR